MIRASIFFFLFFATAALFSQTSNEIASQFQGDSRRTFVNRESVNIFGIRGGVAFNQKYELGIGVYSSNLFGVLGRTVDKNYLDKTADPAIQVPSEIGFHYFSIYGEYTILKNNRLELTTNNQIGLGWVDIDFIATTQGRESIQEGKSLLEHSIKADIKTFEWLRLIGGVGYRYLIGGEAQIKEAFNAPIYIIGFSIDFKLLRHQLRQ